MALLAGILAGGQAYAALKITLDNGQPIVRGVYINGHGPYVFLLDTGTTSNHLDPRLARAIGLKPTFQSELITSAGTKVVPGTDGVAVALGSVRAEEQRFLFAGVDVIRQVHPDVQGVLGQAFLSHFDYVLNLRGKEIEFGKREPNAVAIRAPLRMDHARPVVTTSLGELLLDSGTDWVTLFGVESTGMMNQMMTLAGSLRIGTVSRKLSIGGRAFWRGEALAIPHAAEKGAAGLLPVAVFKTVYFCNSEGYVGLE